MIEPRLVDLSDSKVYQQLKIPSTFPLLLLSSYPSICSDNGVQSPSWPLDIRPVKQQFSFYRGKQRNREQRRVNKREEGEREMREKERERVIETRIIQRREIIFPSNVHS